VSAESSHVPAQAAKCRNSNSSGRSVLHHRAWGNGLSGSDAGAFLPICVLITREDMLSAKIVAAHVKSATRDENNRGRTGPRSAPN